MPKLSDIITKLPKGWKEKNEAPKQQSKVRKPRKSNYARVMEQIEQIGTTGLFSMLKGGYSSNRVHVWDSSEKSGYAGRKKNKKSKEEKRPHIIYTPMGNKR